MNIYYFQQVSVRSFVQNHVIFCKIYILRWSSFYEVFLYKFLTSLKFITMEKHKKLKNPEWLTFLFYHTYLNLPTNVFFSPPSLFTQLIPTSHLASNSNFPTVHKVYILDSCSNRNILNSLFLSPFFFKKNPWTLEILV